MKLKLFSFFILFLSFYSLKAQEFVFGKLFTEDKVEIQGVTVLNVRTDERTLTNREGHFMLAAKIGDEIRCISSGFERFSKRVDANDMKFPINITMIKSAILIEEVELSKKLTGDLKIDVKRVDAPAKVQKLKKEMNRYMSMKTDPRVLAARPGEFVQPVTRGIAIGKIKNKWDDVDVMEYIISALGEKYFTDLQITKPQIQSFIFHIFNRGFERKKILKYGYCSEADLARFQRAVLEGLSSYKIPATTRK